MTSQTNQNINLNQTTQKEIYVCEYCFNTHDLRNIGCSNNHIVCFCCIKKISLSLEDQINIKCPLCNTNISEFHQKYRSTIDIKIGELFKNYDVLEIISLLKISYEANISNFDNDVFTINSLIHEWKHQVNPFIDETTMNFDQQKHNEECIDHYDSLFSQFIGLIDSYRKIHISFVQYYENITSNYEKIRGLFLNGKESLFETMEMKNKISYSIDCAHRTLRMMNFPHQLIFFSSYSSNVKFPYLIY